MRSCVVELVNSIICLAFCCACAKSGVHGSVLGSRHAGRLYHLLEIIIAIKIALAPSLRRLPKQADCIVLIINSSSRSSRHLVKYITRGGYFQREDKQSPSSIITIDHQSINHQPIKVAISHHTRPQTCPQRPSPNVRHRTQIVPS